MGLASFAHALNAALLALDLASSPLKSSGAGEGNRTLVVSLEGFCSTIELHPLNELLISKAASACCGCFASCMPESPGDCWWRRLDSNQRRRKPTDLQSAPFNHSGTPPRRTANYGCATKACQTDSPWVHCTSLLRIPSAQLEANDDPPPSAHEFDCCE
jgi:hypothetical protein